MSFWSNLHKREQRLVIWGGSALVAILIYFLAIEPLGRNLTRMKDEIKGNKADLAWMQVASQKARVLKSLDTKRSSVSPLKAIDQTARRYGIDANLKRVDPGEGDKLKIWFEKVVYVDLMQFLRATVVTSGLTVNTVTVERLDAPGIINARITLGVKGK